MPKKSLEDLIEELKYDLRDAISVLNELKQEIPQEIKSEIYNLREIEVEKLKRLKAFLAKLSQTLENIEEEFENIKSKIDETNEKILLTHKKSLSQIESLLETIKINHKHLLMEIETATKKGIRIGIENQVQEIENKLAKLNLLADKFTKNLEETFSKYQWSWLGAFIFVSILIIIGILYIGLQNAGKEKTTEILVGLSQIVFFLTGAYIAYKTWSKFSSFPWIGYGISLILLWISLLTGYLTYKEKIVITKKEEVCDLPKPDSVQTQKDGSVCYFYDNGFCKIEGEWHKGLVAICKPKR